MTNHKLTLVSKFAIAAGMALLATGCGTTLTDKSIAATATDTSNMTCVQLNAESVKLEKAAEENIADNSPEGERYRTRAISIFEIPVYMIKFRQVNEQISEKRKALDANLKDKNCGALAVAIREKRIVPTEVVKEAPLTIKTTIRTEKMSTSDIQKKLIALGYLRGKSDNIFGKNTNDALKKYQQENGITVNGIPDSETMERLSSR